MSKTIPVFESDEEAERFVETADLADYDLSGFTPTRFEFQAKTSQINMRLSQDMLAAVKATAQREGIPYQRFIRQAIERALTQSKR
jgi:predicted DNA binding CopG/RHH family protein